MIIEPMEQEYDIADQARLKLMSAIPEAFADGKILWEKLRESLGDILDDDDESAFEHYGLNWPGKRRAKKVATTPSTLTLTPLKGEGVDEENTQNIFIEGDNLEVLKILYKSYKDQIKMIYIDPPYNTGNDFVYNDNYRMSEDEFMHAEGTVDEQGNKLVANKKTSGRFHANWLNLMYPRLKISKELLKDDGVIFISIDDNEVHNLRMLCDEIFGEENFISQAGWQKVYSSKNQARYLSNDYEYVLIYAKSLSSFNIGLLPRTEEMDKRYTNIDNDSRGPWKPGDLVAAGERKGGHYIIKNPYNGVEYDVPSGKHWAFSEERMREMLNDDRVFFGVNKSSFPSFKQFLSEVKQGRVPSSLLSYKEYGHTDEAKKDFIKLFGEEGKTIFETLKPVRLIENLARIANINHNDIVLDFFAGSGTTAQSIWKFNLEDKKICKFICVQIPEETEAKGEAFKAGYSVVSDITKERIRRASARIREDNPSYNGDLGFKVYKTIRSNHKKWGKYIIATPKEADGLFKEHEHSLVDGWEYDSVLTEVILTEGFPLTSIARSVSGITSNSITQISSADKEYALYVCLDDVIKPDTIKATKMNDNDVFVCLGSAIDDQNLSGLHDKGRIRIL